jgi:hypothetical protein
MQALVGDEPEMRAICRLRSAISLSNRFHVVGAMLKAYGGSGSASQTQKYPKTQSGGTGFDFRYFRYILTSLLRF